MSQDLDTFFNLVYGDTSGYLYFALKSNSGGFTQDFFKWPDDRGLLANHVQENSQNGEVYFCPSIFADRSATKDQVLGSRVTWVDFDYGLPDTWQAVPEPNIVVRTSKADHAHCYWTMDKFYGSEEIETINRRLAYHFDADTSGWDANQLLRPPNTRNHKRGSNVVLIQGRPASITPEAFKDVPEIAVKFPSALPVLEQLPSATSVIAKYELPKSLRRILTQEVGDQKHSSALVALAYGLRDFGLKDAEVLTLLLEADTVQKKYLHRPDRMERLVEIVALVKSKAQIKTFESDVVSWASMDIDTLLSHDIQLEWLWAPYLFRRGSMILSGPPGVGKSSFSLSLAQHLVLGKPFLGRPLTGGLRVGFLSLEMDVVELQYIVRSQIEAWDTDERTLLKNNLHLFPLGHPINLTERETQENVERIIIENRLDGIIIDSLSSTTPEELASEKEAKKVFDFVSFLRQSCGVFTVYIHHNRKAQSDNRKPTKLADLHGSVHLAGKTSSVVFLWPEPNGTITVISPKVRLGPPLSEYRIERDSNLHLVRSAEGADIMETWGVKDEPSSSNEGTVSTVPGTDFKSFLPSD